MRYAIISIVILLSTQLYSQEMEYIEKEDWQRFSLSLTYNHFPGYENGGSNMFGINMKFDLTKFVSLNYSLSFGSSSEIGSLAHVFAGPVWSYNLISSIESNDGENAAIDFLNAIKAGSILFLLIPEGVTFNLDMNDDYSLNPYINLLGYEYYNERWLMSSEIGLGGTIGKTKNFLIMPKAGYRFFYEGITGSVVLGVEFGYKF